MEDVTILVNSCDKYEDLWYPFFELLRINWTSCPYKIILNTESKNYIHPKDVGGGIKCLQLYKADSNIDWSTRLLQTLKHIDTQFVFFLLDDFFLQEKVNEERFFECLNIARSDKDLGYICFLPYNNYVNKECKYNDFGIVDKLKEYYSCQTQASIWSTSYLKKILRKGESPWEFEEFGSERVRRSKKNVYAYIRKSNVFSEMDLIFPYSLPVTLGYGVWHGKWLFKCKELFERYKINADFSKRDSWSSREEIIAYIEQQKTQAEDIPGRWKYIKHICPKWIKKLFGRLYRGLRKTK